MLGGWIVEAHGSADEQRRFAAATEPQDVVTIAHGFARQVEEAVRRL